MTSPHALRLANILDLMSRLLVGGRGGGRKGLLVLGLLLLCNRKASVSSSGVDGIDLLPRDDDEGGIGGDDGCCCDDETCRWDGEGTGLDDDDDDLEDDCCLFNDCCCCG